MEATLQQFDALRSPGRTIRGHVDRLAPRMMAEMSSSEDVAVLLPVFFSTWRLAQTKRGVSAIWLGDGHLGHGLDLE